MNLFALAYLEKAGEDLTQSVDLLAPYKKGFILSRNPLKRKYFQGSLRSLQVKGAIDAPSSKRDDGATFLGLLNELIEENFGQSTLKHLQKLEIAYLNFNYIVFLKPYRVTLMYPIRKRIRRL